MTRTIALVVGVAAVVMGSKLLIENALGLNLEPFARAWLDDAGIGAAATIVLLLTADILLPIPSSLVMVLSGAAFGTAAGSVIALVGSIGGEWLGFEIVRRYGRRASGSLVGDDEIARLERLFKRHGAAAVAVTRALPVVMETMSIVAGLSGMRRRDFLLASLAGTLPIVVLYAYAGAASRAMDSALPAVIMLIAVAGLGWIVYRARVSD